MFVNVTSCDRGDSDWLTSQCLSLYGRRRRPKYFCTNFKITLFIGKNGDGGTSFVTYSTSLGEGGGGGLSLKHNLVDLITNITFASYKATLSYLYLV